MECFESRRKLEIARSREPLRRRLEGNKIRKFILKSFCGPLWVTLEYYGYHRFSGETRPRSGLGRLINFWHFTNIFYHRLRPLFLLSTSPRKRFMNDLRKKNLWKLRFHAEKKRFRTEKNAKARDNQRRTIFHPKSRKLSDSKSFCSAID